MLEWNQKGGSNTIINIFAINIFDKRKNVFNDGTNAGTKLCKRIRYTF